MHMHTHGSTGGGQDNLWELAFSFQQVGSWNQIQVVRFTIRCLYPLSRFPDLFKRAIEAW